MKRQHLSRRRWLELIEEQRASELSVKAFCERHGLASSTFFNWNRRLKAEGALTTVSRPSEATGLKASPPAEGSTEPPAFVELTASTEADSAERPIELVLPGGVVVRVRRGFDALTLRQIVDALS